MNGLTEFKAVYCSGLFIPEHPTVTALSLLFEKIYLPNNIEIIKEFCKKYEIKVSKSNNLPEIENITFLDEAGSEQETDPFARLNKSQKQTAHNYLRIGEKFSLYYAPLFPNVFETQMFENGDPKSMINIISEGDEDTFPNLLKSGYIPLVSVFQPKIFTNNKLDKVSATQLASLLAMQSLQMFIPRTKAAHPEAILEARSRLSNQLPPFWSAMLKLSVELKKRINEGISIQDLPNESQDLIDTMVRPSLVDLQQKLLKENKEWVYKILSPIQRGLRILIGNPPITQQQLITNALLLTSDVTMSLLENMRAIDTLKNEAGLTFLLDAGSFFKTKG